jgi:hypothetical protein
MRARRHRLDMRAHRPTGRTKKIGTGREPKRRDAHNPRIVMASKRRVPTYDIGPEGITRPDIVPGERRFADSVPSFEARQPRMRELPHYPELRDVPARWNEPTVPDGPANQVSTVTPRYSMVTPRYSDTAPHQSVAPRSGPRHREPSPEVTAETRRRKRDANRELATEPELRTEAPPAAVAPAAAGARRTGRTLLLVFATVAVSAAIGAAVGGVASYVERSVGAPPNEARAAPTPAVAPPAPPRVATPPSEPSVTSAARPAVPVVRFQDLPALGYDPPPATEPSARSRKAPRHPRQRP